MDMTEVKQFDMQVGVLKLSQAIRIGSKMRPQCRLEFFAQGGSCALGAAWEGFGEDPKVKFVQNGLMQRYGLTDWLAEMIVDRNDSGQTREEIADWLESEGY